MQALLASGTVTRAQMKALKDAMKTAGAADRAAASLAALKALAAAGTITTEQLTLIMGRLSMTSVPGVSQQTTQGQGSTVTGNGRGDGATHGNSGQHGQSGLSDDDDDQGEDQDEDQNEDDDQDEMPSSAAS